MSSDPPTPAASPAAVRAPHDAPRGRLSRRARRPHLLAASSLFYAACAGAQSVRLRYDFRHTVDPRNNARDYPTVVYEVYRPTAAGAFQLRADAELNGSRRNVSKVFAQAAQTLRFWKPAVFVHLGYSGGLGLFDGAAGGYYLDNAYLVGAARPFRWGGAWASAYVAYRYANTPAPSHDPQVALYWGRTFRRRWDVASTGVAWTQNRNRGDAWTAGAGGKRASLLVENALWFRWSAHVSAGSETSVSYNVFATDGRLLVYPTLGVRYLF